MARRRKKNIRSEIERAHNRANLRSHIRALGLQSEDQYRAWCRKRGLGDGLHKSNRQIQKERQLARRQQGEAALTRTRQQTRSPANTIRQLYDRTLPKGRLGADYLYKIRGLFNAFPHGPPRRAFLDILLQAARRADLFRLDPVVPAFGAHPDNNFIDGLAALARHSEDWVRPAAEWVPPSHNPRKQFHHLACHLLARYDVPTFMDAAFFTAADARSWLASGVVQTHRLGAEHPHRGPPRRLEQEVGPLLPHCPRRPLHRPRPALGSGRGTRRQSNAGASDNCYPIGTIV